MRWAWVVIGAAILAGVIVMRVSQSGINKIKQHEALSLVPYRDVAGYWTIGYGHKLKPGEWWDQISESFAEQLLRQDLAIAEQAVNDRVTVPLSQGQYDALVSFVFNVGVQAFADSTLLSMLNRGDYQGAANQLLRWKYAGGDVVAGLLARREREKALFEGIA